MALSTSGFDWKRIFLFAGIISLALILTHTVLHRAGIIESTWGPVIVMFVEYFVMVVLAFMAISQMKKAREAPFAFFDVFIHVLAMAMIMLFIYTAYDYMFTTHIDPDLNVRITALQIQEAESTLQESAEFEAAGDTLHSKASKDQMRQLIKEGQARINELNSASPTFVQILQGNISFFMLLFGLVWGLILAVIHRERVVSAE